MKKVLLVFLALVLFFCQVTLTSCDYSALFNYCKHDIPDEIIVIEGKSPTCSQVGLSDGMKCNLCGTMVVPQTIIPKTECIESGWILNNDTASGIESSKYTECIVCGRLIKEQFSSEYDGLYDGSAVTITFWHTMGSDNRALLDDAIARFNTMYPNITVVHQSYGDYDSVFDRIRTKLTTGNQPNLAFCYPDHVATYNQSGSVVVLDEFIANQNVVAGSGEMMGFTQAQLDDFIEGLYNQGKEYGDGKMYSLPFQQSTEVLYYNKTLFDELGLKAPKTWDDVEEICKILKEMYPGCTPLGYDFEENFFITLAAQYGSNYTSATGENYTFVNDTNKQFVAKFAEWYQKGWITTSELMGGSYTSDGFKKADDETGKIFMSIGSSAGARYYRPDKVYGEYPFEVGIVSLPQVDVNNPKVISQGPSICIFEADQQEVYASWLFLKFLTTDKQFQAMYAMKSGYVPVIKSVMETEQYKNALANANGGDYITSLVAVVALQQADAYFSIPAFAGSGNARTQVGLLVQSVFSKYQLGADNTAMIDAEFQKYYDLCKVNY